VPDISIPSPLDYMKIGEADLPNALPWDEIGPSRFSALVLDPSLRVMLTEKSKERLAHNKDMAFLQVDIEKVRTRLLAGTISLNETTRTEEKKAEDLRNEDRKKIEESIRKSSEPRSRLVIDDKKGVILSDKDPKKKKPTFEESADGETEGITDAIDLTETFELKEALNIMGDWLNIEASHRPGTIAKDRDPTKTTVVK
jgi:hypothetical protein